MKKVMFFRPMLYMGGTEIAILNLLKKLSSNKDFEFYVGYSDSTSDSRLLDKFSRYSSVVNVLEEDVEVDILINCSPYKSSIEKFKNVKYNKLFLWFHHFGKTEESIFNDIEHLKQLDKIIVVSETQKRIMLQQSYSPYIYDKIEVIYNILNTDEIIDKSLEPVEFEFNGPLNIVTISRLSPDKGFYRKLVLGKLLKERGIDFKWYIIGSSYYSKIEKDIKKMFKEYKDNFIFLGIKHNPFRILKHCDYLALLSDDETWGMTITEAKILGIPCIITDFDVAFEQITDMENGIILERYNTDSYENRIDDIINNKEKFKNNLKDFVYDVTSIIDTWIDILK